MRLIIEAGGDAFFVQGNVGSEADVRLDGQEGARSGAIHVLYNNAGVMPGEDASVTGMTEQPGRRDGHQLEGRGILLQARDPAYGRRRWRLDHQHRLLRGAAWLHGAAGRVHHEQGRLIALTKSLAVQFAKQGIRANAICPGPIETPLLRTLWTSEDARNLRLGRIPLGRFGAAEDIVYLGLYLASDESSWTTGAVMVVDGGITSNYFYMLPRIRRTNLARTPPGCWLIRDRGGRTL